MPTAESFEVSEDVSVEIEPPPALSFEEAFPLESVIWPDEPFSEESSFDDWESLKGDSSAEELSAKESDDEFISEDVIGSEEVFRSLD